MAEVNLGPAETKRSQPHAIPLPETLSGARRKDQAASGFLRAWQNLLSPNTTLSTCSKAATASGTVRQSP